METFVTHVAGMDVHKKNIVVCVMIGKEGTDPDKETRSFPTFTRNLYEMLNWLESKQVTHVAMESTGIYWKPIYNILEGYFEITLANAQRIKNVPGRKTDVSDAEWIAKLLRHGLIEPSFVPPTDIRELRDLCRFRKKWIGNLTAEKNRIQKVLEASNIKLGTVVSDVFGVSGRNLLTRLINQGYVDLKDLAEDVKGRLKKKCIEISESLFGTLNEHQIFLIRQSWNHIAYIEESLQQIDQRINQILEKNQEEVNLLKTVPGVNDVTAASILAEIGTDMNQFPSAAHLSSWAGVSPGNHESAGKKKHTNCKGKSTYQSSTL